MFQICSSGFSILSIAALHIAIVASIILLRTKNVEDPKFIEKFGELIEGQNVHRKTGKYWTVITLLRQSMLCVTLVCLRNYAGIQIQILLIQSVAM
jgi:hypothetical protein